MIALHCKEKASVRSCASLAIHSFLLPTLLIPISLSVPDVALAQIANWVNTVGILDPWYDVGSNWLRGVAPGSKDIAVFDQPASYEVWWDDTTATTNPDVGFLAITDGDVTFLNNERDGQHELSVLGLDGGGSLSDFSVSGSTTALTIRGLTLHSIGGSQILEGASLTLDGSHEEGAQMSVDGLVGFRIDGTLNIEAGAILSNNSSRAWIGYGSGSRGLAKVSGIDSHWNSSLLITGYEGEGYLIVEEGGELSTSSGWIGLETGSKGTAVVRGENSIWSNSNELVIGYSSLGILSVEGGGVVSSTTGRLGYFNGASGVATVTGSGSRWDNSKELFIGFYRDATLNIEEGGQVKSATSYIGHNNEAKGEVTVAGDGSLWNNFGNLYVADSGRGTLNVHSGGFVNDAGGFVGRKAGSIGVATISGSGTQWNNSSGLQPRYGNVDC